MLRPVSVLDLNHLLLFVACLSPVTVLARTWRDAALNRSWALAAVIVLAITAAAFAITPRHAGFVGGGAWLLLLVLPAFGLRRVAALAAEERFGRTRRTLDVLSFLHPIAQLREERDIMRGLELAQRGETRAATELLTKVAHGNSRAARQASAHVFRLRRDWEGLAASFRHSSPRMGSSENPDLLPLFLRALGETGARDEMVLQFAGHSSALLASPIHQTTFAPSLMLVLAFCGRTQTLISLFEKALQRLPRDAKEFWMATSKSTAGEVAASRVLLERLRRTTSDALIRADCEQRLRFPAHSGRVPLSRASEAMLSRFARNAEMGSSSLLAQRSRRFSPAVGVIIALNAVMFLLEIALGGSTNDLTLHRLGALEPYVVLSTGQYWRLFSALFLHYGPLHLVVNLYALYVLGPPLEALIGATRFALSYLVAGLGSSIGVIALWRFGLTQADFLVGASGAVMGIVGTWAGLLCRHRHVPNARRRLASVGMIVLVQTAFDFMTPQISMAAHLSGFVTGVLVGLLLAPHHEL